MRVIKKRTADLSCCDQSRKFVTLCSNSALTGHYEIEILECQHTKKLVYMFDVTKTIPIYPNLYFNKEAEYCGVRNTFILKTKHDCKEKPCYTPKERSHKHIEKLKKWYNVKTLHICENKYCPLKVDGNEMYCLCMRSIFSGHRCTARNSAMSICLECAPIYYNEKTEFVDRLFRSKNEKWIKRYFQHLSITFAYNTGSLEMYKYLKEKNEIDYIRLEYALREIIFHKNIDFLKCRLLKEEDKKEAAGDRLLFFDHVLKSDCLKIIRYFCEDLKSPFVEEVDPLEIENPEIRAYFYKHLNELKTFFAFQRICFEITPEFNKLPIRFYKQNKLNRNQLHFMMQQIATQDIFGGEDVVWKMAQIYFKNQEPGRLLLLANEVKVIQFTNKLWRTFASIQDDIPKLDQKTIDFVIRVQFMVTMRNIDNWTGFYNEYKQYITWDLVKPILDQDMCWDIVNLPVIKILRQDGILNVHETIKMAKKYQQSTILSYLQQPPVYLNDLKTFFELLQNSNPLDLFSRNKITRCQLHFMFKTQMRQNKKIDLLDIDYYGHVVLMNDSALIEYIGRHSGWFLTTFDKLIPKLSKHMIEFLAYNEFYWKLGSGRWFAFYEKYRSYVNMETVSIRALKRLFEAYSVLGKYEIENIRQLVDDKRLKVEEIYLISKDYKDQIHLNKYLESKMAPNFGNIHETADHLKPVYLEKLKAFFKFQTLFEQSKERDALAVFQTNKMTRCQLHFACRVLMNKGKRKELHYPGFTRDIILSNDVELVEHFCGRGSMITLTNFKTDFYDLNQKMMNHLASNEFYWKIGEECWYSFYEEFPIYCSRFESVIKPALKRLPCRLDDDNMKMIQRLLDDKRLQIEDLKEFDYIYTTLKKTPTPVYLEKLKTFFEVKSICENRQKDEVLVKQLNRFQLHFIVRSLMKQNIRVRLYKLDSLLVLNNDIEMLEYLHGRDMYLSDFINDVKKLTPEMIQYLACNEFFGKWETTDWFSFYDKNSEFITYNEVVKPALLRYYRSHGYINNMDEIEKFQTLIDDNRLNVDETYDMIKEYPEHKQILDFLKPVPKIEQKYVDMAIRDGSMNVIEYFSQKFPDVLPSEEALKHLREKGFTAALNNVFVCYKNMPCTPAILDCMIQSGNVKLVKNAFINNPTVRYTDTGMKAAIKRGNIEMLECLFQHSK